jgi:hypothetical protein
MLFLASGVVLVGMPNDLGAQLSLRVYDALIRS